MPNTDFGFPSALSFIPSTTCSPTPRLQHNLTGPIPPSLAALPDLLRFVASDNNLTGAAPFAGSPAWHASVPLPQPGPRCGFERPSSDASHATAAGFWEAVRQQHSSPGHQVVCCACQARPSARRAQDSVNRYPPPPSDGFCTPAAAPSAGTIPAFASPDLSVLMLDNNNLTGRPAPFLQLDGPNSMLRSTCTACFAGRGRGALPALQGEAACRRDRCASPLLEGLLCG